MSLIYEFSMLPVAVVAQFLKKDIKLKEEIERRAK